MLSTIFAVDMVLKFRLAFRKQEQLVGCPKRILHRYLRRALLAVYARDFMLQRQHLPWFEGAT